MGFFDTIFGNDAADASRRAAADTYAKQQQASSTLRDAGTQYATDFRGLADNFKPYTAAGTSGLEMLINGLGLNGAAGNDAAKAAFRAGPGYQYSVDQALEGVNRKAASTGMLASGNTLAALSDRAGSMADQEYQTWLSNLSGVGNMGLTATGQSVNTIGQGLQGKLNTDLSAFNGDMQSAGTIGQGDVAAANAKSSALQNLLGMATFLGGTALSGGTNLLGGGAARMARPLTNSLFGGGSPSGYGA